MKNSILVKFLGLIVSLTAPAIIALLPVFVGFRDGLTVTDLNDFNGLAQTTNLGAIAILPSQREPRRLVRAWSSSGCRG